MKIKKISLFNIGPYLNRNEFDLTMDNKKNIPENIRQAVDLVSAVLRRIKEKALDKSPERCLYIAEPKGVTT